MVRIVFLFFFRFRGAHVWSNLRMFKFSLELFGLSSIICNIYIYTYVPYAELMVQILKIFKDYIDLVWSVYVCIVHLQVNHHLGVLRIMLLLLLLLSLSLSLLLLLLFLLLSLLKVHDTRHVNVGA